jgi:hypothetical protein
VALRENEALIDPHNPAANGGLAGALVRPPDDQGLEPQRR